MKLSSFYLAILFFIVSFVLLILPGNEFPKAPIFATKGLDKIIHTIMFFTLTYLFCRPFKSSVFNGGKRRMWFLQIALLAFAYGITMEFVQKFWVPFRSFEVADIAVDGLGALLGYLVSRRMFSRAALQ